MMSSHKCADADLPAGRALRATRRRILAGRGLGGGAPSFCGPDTHAWSRGQTPGRSLQQALQDRRSLGLLRRD